MKTGAGPSGLVTAKYLLESEREFKVSVYEQVRKKSACPETLPSHTSQGLFSVAHVCSAGHNNWGHIRK
jgi:flavin-dependent dehydrogenase